MTSATCNILVSQTHTNMGNITDSIARNLRKPESGLIGYYVKRLLKERNHDVELAAVRLSEIEPHHKVLEIGFGPGIGISSAYDYIKEGAGRVFGIDISEAMLAEAERELQNEIKAGKVSLTLGSVDGMPYKDGQFDRLFHCNCYYFWDDLNKASSEMYRVMKPGAKMITTLNPAAIKVGEEKGWLRYGKGDPEPFLEALRSAGFVNVEMKPVAEGTDGINVIYAYVAS